MSFFRRRKKNDSVAKPAGPQERIPTTPKLGALRQDGPAQVVDLSDNAFERDFPKIAQRMDAERRGHRRRTAEQRTTKPPPMRGEETTDT